MKQRNYYLPLIIFSSIIFYSCTVTKRHFGSGYHVEWNRKIKALPEQEEIPKIEVTESEFEPIKTSSADSVLFEASISAVPAKLTEDQPEEHQFRTKQLLFGEEIKPSREPGFQKKEEIEEKLSAEEPKPRMHPLTWGIWGMWSIAIACMFFVTFYAEALIGVGLGFFIAMIFAFIIVYSLRKHPEKYRLKKLSYGFVIPAIIFGGIALAGFGLFLLMMFSY